MEILNRHAVLQDVDYHLLAIRARLSGTVGMTGVEKSFEGGPR